jgi:hypothetical protein
VRTDAAGETADGGASSAKTASKPKTTVRKTLQRKAKPKKPESPAKDAAGSLPETSAPEHTEDVPSGARAEEPAKPESDSVAQDAASGTPADNPEN